MDIATSHIIPVVADGNIDYQYGFSKLSGSSQSSNVVAVLIGRIY